MNEVEGIDGELVEVKPEFTNRYLKVGVNKLIAGILHASTGFAVSSSDSLSFLLLTWQGSYILL